MVTLEQKLESIKVLVEDALAKDDMLVSTYRLLQKVVNICNLTEEKPKRQRKKKMEEPVKEPDHISVSVDASIKKNPGGPAAIGFVVKVPGRPEVQMSKIVPALTNNEAEYDAVYEGILFAANLLGGTPLPIHVFSDSQLVVKQLNGEYKISPEQTKLQSRHQSIHGLCSLLPVPVKLEWKPRNSTAGLQQANYLAQDALGVPRH